MCIIVFKPENQNLPNKKTLLKCWDNNPDGAGYMFPKNGEVVIKKGFMDFNSFFKSLIKDKNEVGVKTPFVLHFRVSTQAGVTPECTHPFPLSSKMDDLKHLRVRCQCGIAHNGVIELTSTRWDKTITYSDTMEFITDYLTLIITTKDWHRDNNKKLLIERLADSKLAIMMASGHVELIGDFIKDNGCYYSNNYYREARWTYTSSRLSDRHDYELFDYDDWKYYTNNKKK